METMSLWLLTRVLETEAANGAYAIAFSEDYEKKQDAAKAFETLENE